MTLKVRAVYGLFLTLAVALSAIQPQPSLAWRTVHSGVEHVHLVKTMDAGGRAIGPWNINLLRVDTSQVRLDVLHARDEAVGVEPVSSIARRHHAIAAVNGGYFRTIGRFRGDSTGTLQIDGALLSEPDRDRAAIGFVRSGTTTQLIFDHVAWTAALKVAGRSRPLDGLNRPRGENEVIAFTPKFHPTTLTDPTGTEIVVRSGRVEEIRDEAGDTPIPSDGFVLSVTGTHRQWARRLRPGARVALWMAIEPARRTQRNVWATAEDILGAGPKLVTKGGVDITIGREKMSEKFATDRHPRTAIARLPDGKALLAVVDGRQPTLSIGMTLDELARLLIEYGAIEGMNLDGGGSTTMVVHDKVVNQPSDPSGERPVSDAIVIRPVTARVPVGILPSPLQS